MDKEKLDEILETHKAQPVGDGYIDIIVSRERYESFINDLIDNGFVVKSISWWEWCPSGKEAQYGLGGPRSNFYEGWFSELPIDVDDIEISEKLEKEEIIGKLKSYVETKEISYPNEKIEFKKNNWLTPAIWLDVPGAWRNKYCA